MNRWWAEQRTRLWWKESQEVLPYLGLAWLLIHVFMLFAASARGYIWGYSFHLQAAAILLFISIVMGVSAYAVEEEQETLQPLLSKPIPEDDVLATKLGVRLGLIFLSLLYLGMVELLTGAWPIEFRIPAPAFFERWLGTLMICILGMELGLYFGKILGRQTQALVFAALILLGGWILLGVSPLSFAFEGTEEHSYTWIRDILIPFLVNAVILSLIIRARSDRIRSSSRRRIFFTAGSLACYAFLLWIFTIAPPGSDWLRPSHFSDYLTVRYGGPEAALDVLTGDIEESLHDPRHPERTLRRIAQSTHINYSSLLQETRGDTYTQDDIFGRPVEVSRNIPEGYRVYGLSDLVDIASTKRRAGFVARCLELARESNRSTLYRITAIHLAGAANHPGQIELIEPFLHDQEHYVRLYAAMMLTAGGDQQARSWLQDYFLSLTPEDDDHVFIYWWGWWRYIEPGPEAYSIMRQWVVNEDRQMMVVARNWFLKYGSPDDLGLIKQSIELDTYRDNDEILNFLNRWNPSAYLPALLDTIDQERVVLARLKPLIEEIPIQARQNNQYLKKNDRHRLARYSGIQRSLHGHLLSLFRGGEERGAIEIWQDVRPYYKVNTGTYGRYIGASRYAQELFLTYLPRFGEDGIEILKAITTDDNESLHYRMQASLILAAYGYEEYHHRALQLFERHSISDNWFNSEYVRDAFLTLLKDGHLAYAGPLIQHDLEALNERGFGGLSGGRLRITFRTSNTIYHQWDYDLLLALSDAIDEPYGWNLRAWKRWWDREGQQLAAEQLASYSTGNN